MRDSWQSGDPYEYFMGRWSKLIAEQFVDWLSPEPGLRWLDVGCGSGALSEAIINRHNPASIDAIDQSEGFVRTAQQRLGSRASCRTGNALALPFEDDSIDITVSGLVLNFIPDPVKALVEMHRVTCRDGIVGTYIWDYSGKMEFLQYFWDAAVQLNPDTSDLHEGHRFSRANAEYLVDLFDRAGFSNVEAVPLEIATEFSSFDDYWDPFLGGQGPAPTYVSMLEDLDRNQLKEILVKTLPVNEDGKIVLSARAWAAKGNV